MTSNIDCYARAWEFVTLRHMGQSYGGRQQGQQIPYINHLASVAAEVAWGIGGDPAWDIDLAIQCALLHDVIEDTDTSFEQVRSEFGGAVASGVQALTKDTSIDSRAMQMSDSLARIQLQSKEIWAVKLADRIANLYHPPFYWTSEKIDQYKVESHAILAALGSANARLAARLADKIAGYGLLI
jgi:(p)ppGpp synthase/HD superfamily hydrolase